MSGLFRWNRIDDEGRSYNVLPRYNPVRYRVPPGAIEAFRERNAGETVRDMITPANYPPGEHPLDMFHRDSRHLLKRDGKEWLFAYNDQENWAMELEVRDDGIGEIREVPPARAFAHDFSHERDIRPDDPDMGPDPRYREVLRDDGVREYWRVHNPPAFFTVPARRIAAIRRDAAKRGWVPLRGDVASGPFDGFFEVDRFERDGRSWVRLLYRDEEGEYAIDVELSASPDFEIRPLPPEWTWRWVCQADARTYPDLRFER